MSETACCAADWLGLIAAPTFAGMAVWSALWGGQPDMVCMQGASSSGGMTMMYLLMSAFHLAPWLRLAARRPLSAAQ